MNSILQPARLWMALLALMSFTSATFADDPSSPLTISNYVARIRVACVGDSITFGMGVNGRESNSYPVQLNRMLGDKWEVQNFGVSARTLLNKGDYPYQKEAAFQNALNFNPNVVVILLGANDSKPLNWKFKDEFVPDYKELIRKFKALAGHPQIFICQPTPVPGNGNWGINEPTVQDEIKLINGIAKDENVGIIDLHRALEGKDELIPDRVHPNAAGATVLAQTVYKTLTGKEFVDGVPAESSAK